MRIAYFDCAYGVAGDMIMGALVDAGAPFEEVREAIEQGLGVPGMRLTRSRVTRAGVSATKIHVEVDPAQEQHRRLNQILGIIERSALPARAKARACAAYRRLAEAEARVHQTTPESIHFHEVGCLDAIADVAGGMLALELLGVERVEVSPIATGSGTARCAHGVIPVPAPATVELLRGAPTFGGGFTMEMATPTGAAILAAVAAAWGSQPIMAVEKVGHGSGEREIAGHANFLRVMIGEGTPSEPQPDRAALAGEGAAPAGDAAGSPDRSHTTHTTDPAGSAHAHPHPHEHPHEHPHPHAHEEPGRTPAPQSQSPIPNSQSQIEGALDVRPLTLLMTEVDDMSPELLGDLMARLFAAGCLDAHFTPVQMKKNRPGVQIQVLCDPSQRAKFVEMLLRETSTFGLKALDVERFCLARRKETIQTEMGPLEVKIGFWNGEILKVTPEYESCRRLAEATGMPLAEVYARALVAIRAQYCAA